MENNNKKQIILDGVKLSNNIKNNLSIRVKRLNEIGIFPSLATVLVGSDVASIKYVNSKHKDCEEVGIKSIRREFDENITTDQLLNEIITLNKDKNCGSYIVQLPLPKHIDIDLVLSNIDPRKDADGLHIQNLGKLVLDVNKTSDSYYPIPCTPNGVLKLIDTYLGSDYLSGKNVAVIGRGITIGRTIPLLLTQKQIDATTTIVHSKSENIDKIISKSDVIISAIGKGYFVKKEWIKDGAVLIDVGVSRNVDGKICGDFDLSCYKKAFAYSPNPGGVGPMTRVMLLQNCIDLCENNANLS